MGEGLAVQAGRTPVSNSIWAHKFSGSALRPVIAPKAFIVDLRGQVCFSSPCPRRGAWVIRLSRRMGGIAGVSKVDIGRMGENIVTNELIARRIPCDTHGQRYSGCQF